MSFRADHESPAPVTRVQERTERVVDARCCVLSRCRFLQTAQDAVTGTLLRSCAAGVWKASLPAAGLQDEVRRNPDPLPGADRQNNPFLLRLLMSPQCVRPECGVTEVTHVERAVVLDRADIESELFRRR